MTTTAKTSHYLMPWNIQARQTAPTFSSGQGCYLIDQAGKRYFDLTSGWMCSNLGHQHPLAISAIREQLDRLLFAPPNLAVDIREEYSRELCQRAPWLEGARVHFTSGGADANDDAVKTARRLTGRFKVLAAYRSFHGDTAGAGALSGGSRRWANEPNTAPGVVRFFSPMPYRSPFQTDDPNEETTRALEHLERVMLLENPENIAAVIIEPVLGAEGAMPYSWHYLQGVRDLTSRFGALLIHDEVVTGFGRVGEIFASSRHGLYPDMITFAKGVTGGYVPLGGFLMREGLASAFDSHPFNGGHTYSGHPLAMAAGAGALLAYDSGGLFQAAYRIENWLREGLLELQQQLPVIGDVRGLGAFFGVELVKDRKGKEPVVPWQGRSSGIMEEFSSALLNEGVWLNHKWNLCLFAPPLIATEDEIRSAIATFGKQLRKFASRMAE